MSKKTYSLEEINKVLTFIRQNYKKLAVKEDQEGFRRILEHLETAKTLVEPHRRYAVCLMDAATKYANQLAFRLYIEENLDEETAAVFRSFASVKEVMAVTNEVANEDKARVDEITRLQQEYMNERKPFEIFQAVAEGMSLEEATRRREEYEANRDRALHDLGKN